MKDQIEEEFEKKYIPFSERQRLIKSIIIILDAAEEKLIKNIPAHLTQPVRLGIKQQFIHILLDKLIEKNIDLDATLEFIQRIKITYGTEINFTL